MAGFSLAIALGLAGTPGVVLAGTAGAPPSAPAPAQATLKGASLSLDQAGQAAVTQGASLRAARLALEAAQVRYDRAMATNATSPSALAEAVATNELTQARRQFEDAYGQAIQALIQAFVNVEVQRVGLEVAQLQEQVALTQRDAMREKVRAGNAGPLDAQQSEVDLATARLGVTRARADLAKAVADLEAATGLAGLGGRPLVLPEAAAWQGDLEQAVARARQASRLLQEREQAVDIARRQLEQARLEGASELDRKERENAVQQAEVARDQAQADLERQVRAAVDTLQTDWTNLTVTGLAVELEQARLRGIQQQRERGLRTEQDVRNGQVAVAKARQNQLRALGAYLADLVGLRRLIGEPLGVGPKDPLDAVRAAGPSQAPPERAGTPGEAGGGR